MKDYIMTCPNCNSPLTKVIETRSSKDGNGTRRRRRCRACDFRFSTMESLCLVLPTVIKKSGQKQVFSKDKVLSGMKFACQKRPVRPELLSDLAEKAFRWAATQPGNEVSSSDIGYFVMGHLKKLDEISSLRFASVHKSFSDLEEFVNHLEKNF